MTQCMGELVLIIVFFVPVLTVSAADITKRNGETLKGEVKGLVIQKGTVKKEDGGAEGTSYRAVFFAVNGADIAKIDYDGLHYRPNSNVGALIVFQKGKEPDLIEALETAVKNPPPQGSPSLRLEVTPSGALVTLAERGTQGSPTLWLEVTPSGALVTLAKRGIESSLKCEIVGVFEMPGDKGTLVPSIEVITADKTLKIPVIELRKLSTRMRHSRA